MNAPMKTKIRSLPKYIVGENFAHPPAHSEIVVFPDPKQIRVFVKLDYWLFLLE